MRPQLKPRLGTKVPFPPDSQDFPGIFRNSRKNEFPRVILVPGKEGRSAAGVFETHYGGACLGRVFPSHTGVVAISILILYACVPCKRGASG